MWWSWVCFGFLQETCPKCCEKLSALEKKPQRNTNDKMLLVTKMHVIELTILSKRCRKCSIVFMPETYNSGLLNIGNITLISLDIFWTLRSTVRFVTIVCVFWMLSLLEESGKHYRQWNLFCCVTPFLILNKFAPFTHWQFLRPIFF